MEDLIAITTVDLTLGNSNGEKVTLNDIILNNVHSIINANGNVIWHLRILLNHKRF